MAAEPSTVRCYGCQEIKDVVTTEEPWLAMAKDWVPTEFYFGKAKAHRTELWTRISHRSCGTNGESGG
jgi:hypothetical protein